MFSDSFPFVEGAHEPCVALHGSLGVPEILQRQEGHRILEPRVYHVGFLLDFLGIT